MPAWSNRRAKQYVPRIIEGPREVFVLDEGYVGAKGEMLFFRPTRGSGGFSLYSSSARAKQQAAQDGEKQTRVRIYLEILNE